MEEKEQQFTEKELKKEYAVFVQQLGKAKLTFREYQFLVKNNKLNDFQSFVVSLRRQYPNNKRFMDNCFNMFKQRFMDNNNLPIPAYKRNVTEVLKPSVSSSKERWYTGIASIDDFFRGFTPRTSYFGSRNRYRKNKSIFTDSRKYGFKQELRNFLFC